MIIGAGSQFEFIPKEGIVHVTTLIISAAMALALAAPAAAQSQDVDLTGADGTNLKATYMSPGRPGPAMLLVHQCNMDRTSWSGIASQLVDAGVHVLALDLRGFGDSGGQSLRESGFPAFMQKSPGDVDVAFDYLASQSGVDGMRLAAGGASCGAMLTADLAMRRPVKALMLLSGPPSDAAVANMASSPALAVFAAAATGDTVTPGVADALGGAVDGSGHPRSTAKIYDGPEHGLPMFDKNPDLEPALVSWLKGELLSN